MTPSHEAAQSGSRARAGFSPPREAAAALRPPQQRLGAPLLGCLFWCVLRALQEGFLQGHSQQTEAVVLAAEPRVGFYLVRGTKRRNWSSTTAGEVFAMPLPVLGQRWAREQSTAHCSPKAFCTPSASPPHAQTISALQGCSGGQPSSWLSALSQVTDSLQPGAWCLPHSNGAERLLHLLHW